MLFIVIPYVMFYDPYNSYFLFPFVKTLVVVFQKILYVLFLSATYAMDRMEDYISKWTRNGPIGMSKKWGRRQSLGLCGESGSIDKTPRVNFYSSGIGEGEHFLRETRDRSEKTELFQLGLGVGI